MTRKATTVSDTLDVLIIESHPHAADFAAAELEHAGHRVHRCQEDGGPSFPCRGIADPSACPIDDKADVALLVRRRIAPHPTGLEHGVTCAIRAGVPLVEEGTEALDPFAPWVDMRIKRGDDVVQACRDAARTRHEPLRVRISERTSALLVGASIDPAEVLCHIEAIGSSLAVHLRLPTRIERPLEQALAVRVLDAVRGQDRTYGHIDVHVHAPQPEEPSRYG